MTPDDLAVVASSWTVLSEDRAPLIAALAAHFGSVADDPSVSAMDPLHRAVWLVTAVNRLVGMLVAPSLLADAAREVGATWPDPRTAPSFHVEGRAWMAAARQCVPTWSRRTEDGWRAAWLLLSDVLAAETLSPFSD